MTSVLFVLGLIFPFIAAFSFVVSWVDWWWSKRHNSAVFIPFIGPILLSAWVLVTGRPGWLVPIVWLCDIGTVVFLLATPRLISDWWQTCSYTQIIGLEGRQGNASATLSFHSTGRYFLRKTWHRQPGDHRVGELGEAGSFTRSEGVFQMQSDFGWRRQVLQHPDGTFQVSEDEVVARDQPDYSIADWLIVEQHNRANISQLP